MNNTIGILGCGWLGLPLAKSFIKDGYTIHGSTTSEEKLTALKNEGIQAFKIKLSEASIQGPISDFLANLETIIINVPPRLRDKNPENYVAKIKLLSAQLAKSTVKNIVFVSSTSVYGDLDGIVDENTFPKPVTPSGIQLIASEKLVKDLDLQSTIIRFGGLLGPSRHPINMLSGRENLTNGNAPINLIHLDDCIGILKAIVKNNWWNEIINGVYPYHPTKQEYYRLQAKKRGLIAPEYKSSTISSGKKIITTNPIITNEYNFKTSVS